MPGGMHAMTTVHPLISPHASTTSPDTHTHPSNSCRCRNRRSDRGEIRRHGTPVTDEGEEGLSGCGTGTKRRPRRSRGKSGRSTRPIVVVTAACWFTGLTGRLDPIMTRHDSFAMGALSTRHIATPKMIPGIAVARHRLPFAEYSLSAHNGRRRHFPSPGLFGRTGGGREFLRGGDASRRRTGRVRLFAGNEWDDGHVQAGGANTTASAGGDIPVPTAASTPSRFGERRRWRGIVPLLPNVGRVADTPQARIAGLLLIGGILASLAMEGGMPGGVGGGSGGPAERTGDYDTGGAPSSPIERFLDGQVYDPQQFLENMLDPQPLLEGIASSITGGDVSGDSGSSDAAPAPSTSSSSSSSMPVSRVEEGGAEDLAGAVLEEAGERAAEMAVPAKGIARKVIGVAVPTTATDAAAVAVGEGIAGVLSAASVAVLRAAMVAEMNRRRAKRAGGGGSDRREEAVADAAEQVTGGTTTGGVDVTTANNDRSGGGRGYGLVTEAVADGDYFLTRAAALPLLTEGLGVPLEAASIVSVLWALVPYELIKWSARARGQRRLGGGGSSSFSAAGGVAGGPPRVGRPSEADGAGTLEVGGVGGSDGGGDAVVAERIGNIDLIELFADVTKWLEYDVLMKDFAGKTVLSTAATGGGAAPFLAGVGASYPILDGRFVLPLPPFISPSGLESAAFGFVAALSSQFYADVLNRYTPYGSDYARGEVRARSLRGWADLYASKSLQAAALFGVYESVRGPIGRAIVAFLTSGVDGCVGSNDFAFCMETYMIENPPEASPEAQFRAFVTATLGLFERFGFFRGSDGYDLDALSAGATSSAAGGVMYGNGFGGALGPENVRALAVSLYSLLQNSIPFVENFSFF